MKEAHLFKITVFAVKDYIFSILQQPRMSKILYYYRVLMHL